MGGAGVGVAAALVFNVRFERAARAAMWREHMLDRAAIVTLMQPILAESAHPARAAAFAVVLAIVASLVMIPGRHRPNHREHHQLPRLGKCVQYSYLLR